MSQGGGDAMLSMQRFALETLLQDIADYSNDFKRTRVNQPYEEALLGADRDRCEGDEYVEQFERALEYLDDNGYRRSMQQRVMHKAFLSISVTQLYGDQLEQNLVRLLRKTGFSELRNEALILAPRRFGKTMSSGLWIAVELVLLRGHDVLVYSTNQRASDAIREKVFAMLRVLQPIYGGAITSNTKGQLFYKTREGYVNKLFAFPAEPKNLRGTGSTSKTGTVLLEEMAFMKSDLVMEIVAPTLTRYGVKLIGITTLSGPDSFLGPMAEAKFPDGRSVLLTINFELVCAECKRAGLAEKCKCLMGDIPYWQSMQQHDKLSYLMAGHNEQMMKELKGFAIEENVESAFERGSVEYLSTGAAIEPNASVHSPEIFVAVDPARGGKYSKFAVMSAIFVPLNNSTRQRMVVSYFTYPLRACVCVYLCAARRRRLRRCCRPPRSRSRRCCCCYFAPARRQLARRRPLRALASPRRRSAVCPNANTRTCCRARLRRA